MVVVVNLMSWISIMVALLLAIPMFTLFERKVLSYVQNRKGPKKVSFLGLLQPVSDGLKLLTKNLAYPFFSKKIMFFVCPMILFLTMLVSWFFFSVHKFSNSVLFLSILLFFCVNSLNIYTLLGSGLSSNSKYASMGALRGGVLVISYEMALLTLLFLPCSLKKSFKFLSFFGKYSNLWVFMMPVVVMWLMSVVAETNRAPFDFAEGESELVSGFKVEYGSFSFALLFLGEYGKIILVSMISSLLFFPHWFFLKMVLGNFFCFFFILFRASYPRWRIDFMTQLGWLMILPMGLFYFFLLLSL